MSEISLMLYFLDTLMLSNIQITTTINKCYTSPYIIYDMVVHEKLVTCSSSSYKLIVQVDEIFLLDKYFGTLLIVIAEDENHNVFSIVHIFVRGPKERQKKHAFGTYPICLLMIGP